MPADKIDDWFSEPANPASTQIDFAKLRREATDYANTKWPSKRHWLEIRDEHFARLVRNAALNEAVNECFAIDNTGDYVCHNRDDCANAIDALKEMP
jgi:hypothetical protein